jgi:hypothetical protein
MVWCWNCQKTARRRTFGEHILRQKFRWIRFFVNWITSQLHNEFYRAYKIVVLSQLRNWYLFWWVEKSRQWEWSTVVTPYSQFTVCGFNTMVKCNSKYLMEKSKNKQLVSFVIVFCYTCSLLLF